MSSFKCDKCGADCIDSPNGYITGCEHYPVTAMGRRLSDDPGLTEMKRMEYLMSKAPCLNRHVNPPIKIEGYPDLEALADWSAGDN